MLIDRDDGFKCFYCKTELTQKTAILEHLNSKRYDNRLDNFVLACQSCNIKKIKDPDLQEMAYHKLEQNELMIYVGENYLKKLEDGSYSTAKEASKEIDINMVNFKITQQYITKTIEACGFVEYSEALNSCSYICKTESSHGSQQSIRNYISSLTSKIAPFEVKLGENGKKVIVKRTSQSKFL